MRFQLLPGHPARPDQHPDFPAEPHVLLIYDDTRRDAPPILCQMFPSELGAKADPDAWAKALVLIQRVQRVLSAEQHQA